METLLDEMVSYDDATIFPGYVCLQESSYDRESTHPDSTGWFANNDGFGIKRVDTIQGRIEKVLFDQEGPGVITRIWITAMNKQGTLRFYFDGSSDAGWTIPAYDLVKFGIPLGNGLLLPHTSYTEEGKGGSTLFLPIPYGKSCKVTMEDTFGEKETPKYYQFNFRKYPQGTAVETFSLATIQRAQSKILEVSHVLLTPPTYRKGVPVEVKQLLQSYRSLTLDLPNGANAIRTIQFSVNVADSATFAQVMRELFVEIEFDGTKTVNVPLGDFSGAGVGAPAVDSWFLSSDGSGNITSRWVMPYKEYAKVSLVNYSSEKIDVAMQIYTSSFSWTDQTLYFHSAWHTQYDIPLTNNSDNDCIDWNFITIKGRGVYKGDVLSLFNHAPSWYGEGDEKIYVDDEKFPSHFGTGTEDYYNSSWAPVIIFQTPFGGAPRADLESSHGYNTFFRTRNLDGIPFQRKMVFDIEMLSWEKGSADYYTTVYWYGDINSIATNASDAEMAKSQLPLAPKEPEKYLVKDAIEFEQKKVSNKSQNMTCDAQNMVGFTSDKWSNGQQLLCTGGKEGDFVTFVFDNLGSAKYEIVLYATKAADYGIIAFTVNDKPANVILDCYSEEVKNSGGVRLGIFDTKDGNITLGVKIMGTNTKSVGNRYFVGLDCIQLIKK